MKTGTLEAVAEAAEIENEDEFAYLLGFAKYERIGPTKDLKPHSIQFAHPENAEYNGV